MGAEVLGGGGEDGGGAVAGELEEAELEQLFLRGHGALGALGGEGEAAGGGAWIFDVVLIEQDAPALTADLSDGGVEDELHDGVAVGGVVEGEPGLGGRADAVQVVLEGLDGNLAGRGGCTDELQPLRERFAFVKGLVYGGDAVGQGALAHVPVGDSVEGWVVVHPHVAEVAGVDAAAGVGEADDVGELVGGAEELAAFAGEHQDVVAVKGGAAAHQVVFAWRSAIDERAGVSAAGVDVDAAGSGGIGEFRVGDADLAQGALDGVRVACGDGEFWDVAFALVLGEACAEGGVGAGSDGGNDDLAAPAAGLDDERDTGADGDVVDGEGAVERGSGADERRA